jgi:hypothetical protein
MLLHLVGFFFMTIYLFSFKYISLNVTDNIRFLSVHIHNIMLLITKKFIL